MKVDYPQITLKVFTKKTLKHISQGVAKLSYEVLMGLISDTVSKYELIAGASFTLAEDEAIFEFERLAERKTQGSGRTNVRVPADVKISFKELSEKSGIPIWKIVDHVLRLWTKYEYFSGKGTKWRRRIRDAIKRQSSREDRSNNEIQLNKIDFTARAPPRPEKRIRGLEENPVVESVVGSRPIARDRATPKRLKGKRKIKFIFPGSMSVNNAVRFMLDNYNVWYRTNIDFLRNFIEKIERNRNPINLEVITKNHHYVRGDILARHYLEPYRRVGSIISINEAKSCYHEIGLKWSYPDWLMWLERLVSFWEDTHPYRRIVKLDLTTREWFTKYGLELPDVLEEISNEVVLNYTELKRTGIISDIDLKIKEYLGIENRIEFYYNHFDELDPIEKIEASILVNSSEGYHQQYAQLLREKLKRDKDNNRSNEDREDEVPDKD